MILGLSTALSSKNGDRRRGGAKTRHDHPRRSVCACADYSGHWERHESRTVFAVTADRVGQRQNGRQTGQNSEGGGYVSRSSDGSNDSDGFLSERAVRYVTSSGTGVRSVGRSPLQLIVHRWAVCSGWLVFRWQCVPDGQCSPVSSVFRWFFSRRCVPALIGVPQTSVCCSDAAVFLRCVAAVAWAPPGARHSEGGRPLVAIGPSIRPAYQCGGRG